jgi:hypothetical protein
VQQLEIAVIVILVIGIVVAVSSVRARQSAGVHRPLTPLIIGSVLGLLGAFVVLTPGFDVVPDAWQGALEPILIGGVTVVLVLVSLYRMAR